MTLKIPFLFFFIYPIISSAGLIISTNQINCVYEDTALSERERRLIREDLSRAMARNLEEGDWYQSHFTESQGITNQVLTLKRRYSCNWPNEIKKDLRKVVLDSTEKPALFVSNKISDVYKQKIALIDQYPTLYPSLCTFVSFLADKSNLHNLTEEEELNYVLPMISKSGEVDEPLLKYSFDKDLFLYPPCFASIQLLPPADFPKDEIEIARYRFSRTPNSETHMPNFMANFFMKDIDSYGGEWPVPVVFVTNQWKILNN